MTITKPSKKLVLKDQNVSGQSRKRAIYRSEKAEEKAQKPDTSAFNGAQAQEGPVGESNAVLQKAQDRDPNDREGQNEYEPPSKR